MGSKKEDDFSNNEITSEYIERNFIDLVFILIISQKRDTAIKFLAKNLQLLGVNVRFDNQLREMFDHGEKTHAIPKKKTMLHWWSELQIPKLFREKYGDRKATDCWDAVGRVIEELFPEKDISLTVSMGILLSMPAVFNVILLTVKPS